jgi:adenylate kinase
LGAEIHGFLKDGNFVPDSLILKIVYHWLQAVKEEFVLDGFPRTLAQGNALDQFLSETHRPEATAVYLDVPMPILEQRIAQRVGCDPCGNVWSRPAPSHCPDCGVPVVPRIDDSTELYRARLAEYQRKTLPLLPYYEDHKRLRRVCGQGSPDAVFQRIVTALAS